MKISRLFACLLALCAFGCGDDSPTAPTNLPGTPITELFIGTLPVGGSSFYSIGFPEMNTVRVTLIALSSATGVLTPANVSLRLGVPSGTTCAPTNTQDVTPAFTQQIAAELPASTYCVGIADTGSLTQPTNFLIRINQIPGSSRPPIPATPSSETFASNLALRGTSARTFAATGNGQVTLRIQSLGASDALVDLGFGIPRSDGSGCLIAQTVRGGVGSQISTPVDLGPYCVVITDFGNLTAPTSFSINITKP